MKAIAILGGLLLVCAAHAAIPVTPFGSSRQTFDNRPNITEWATWRPADGSSTISTPAGLDALVQTQSVARFTEALWSTFSSPALHVVATWTGSQQAIYTGPAGTAANVLLATLSNAHTAPITRLRVGYRQEVLVVNGQVLETVPGQRVFYSFTGQPNSWTFIPELSDGTTSGYRQAWLNLGSWAPGALLYLLWADDDSQYADACYTIDDFEADTLICDSFPGLQPFQNLNVVEGSFASFSIGLCPHEEASFQWYKDDVLLQGATNRTLPFSPVKPSDAGVYFARLSGPDFNLDSRRATLAVSPDVLAPAALLAYRMVETNDAVDRLGVFFSERIDTNSATRPGNYQLRNLDGTSAPTSILNVSIANESNVVISISPVANARYNLVISNVLDRDTTPNVLAPNPTILPVQTIGTSTVVSATHEWRYHEATNLSVPPGWTSPSFDDAAWPTGMGALGFPYNEPLPSPFQVNTTLGPPSAIGAITAYFRTRFVLGPDQTNRVLQLAGVFDDGAAVYLNGHEVWRERLPAGPLSATTYATNAPENTGPLGSGPVDIFIPGLLRTTNTLAVEVHQVTITSGDVIMGLTARLSEAPCVPRLEVTRGPTTISLRWDCGGVLQVKTNLSAGLWQDIVTPTNAFTTNITGNAMFFRVRE